MILLPENMTANTPPDTVRQVKCHNLSQFDFEKTSRSLHHFTSHTTFGMLLETVEASKRVHNASV